MYGVREGETLMGHQPRRDPGSPPAALYGPQIIAPDRESFHLGVVRREFIAGHLTLEEFEQGVEHVLGGGWLNADGTVSRPAALAVGVGTMTTNEVRAACL